MSLRLQDARRDEGFSLVLVMGFTAVIAGVVLLAATLGVRSLRSSSDHLNFELALSTAESGVDRLLAEVSADYATSPATPYESTGTCGAAQPAGGFATAEDERAWARDTLASLPDACLLPSPQGEYVAVRPSGPAQVVYAMGWYPSRTTPGAARRLVKAEYLFAPYKPSSAVLTQGSLDFSGSVAVNAVGAATGANVHTNSTITGYNNSLNVQGALSSSGTPLPGSCPAGVTGGCTDEQPLESLPVINPAQVYAAQAVVNTGAWWDLCPDGTVRSPSALGPCQGSPVGSSGYRGWQFAAGSGSTPPTWTLPKTAGGPFNGTYYVHEGDAVVGSNGNSSTLWQITVLASSKTAGVTNPATCDKLGGNIEWKLFDMTPKLQGLQLLAQANLTGSANNTAGSGLFMAGDKVDLNTSSATINGAVVAGNSCAAAGPNTIQGVTINYDDTVEAPVADVIRTTLWLEYASG